MIILQNISKYYHTDASVTQALRKINLEFHAGEFVAVTGESGSGKSTLLNVISGMDTFEEGELYFEGEPTFQFDAEQWEDFRRDKIGFVFQDYSLIGHYSALENITAALFIMGIEKSEAEERAEKYLEKVGLKGLENQKASELSSGQKQRLSIARALAKETPVIMADEPTGNLDSETGEQIIRLLRELSEKRLVIMVTHNYEQAEPYVTRKVRLHDGEVVADVPVNKERKDKRESENGGTSLSSGQNAGGNLHSAAESPDMPNSPSMAGSSKMARIFAGLNRKTQRGRSLLFRIFFLFTAIISFLFIGELYANADDIHTKNYDQTIFYQKNDSRLSVQRNDGKPITEKDIEKMNSIWYVSQVDPYDYVNDINYYIEENKDYKFVTQLDEEMNSYEERSEISRFADKSIPVFLKKKKFMRSVLCISESDLEEGKLPEERNEIVLSAGGKYRSGDEVEIYFTSENIWGNGEYYHHKFKITGLLKENTSQVYFHEDLCHMLSAPADGDGLRMDYCYNPRYGYMGSDRFFMVIGEEEDFKNRGSGEFCAIASGNYLVPLMQDYIVRTVETAVTGENEAVLKVNTNRKGSMTKELLAMDGAKQKINVSGEIFNHQSASILEVPKETFDAFYPRKSTQASVYIKNYTKTDRVIQKLEHMGYQAISTYRISSVTYNEKKVMDRLIFIGISLGILIVLVVVEILILRSIMKIRIKDFFVMKSMGMKMAIIKRISFYEMTRYCIEAVILTCILMMVLNLSGVSFISEIIIYYGISAVITYLLYNLLLEWMTVGAFNRLLKGRMAG